MKRSLNEEMYSGIELWLKNNFQNSHKPITRFSGIKWSRQPIQVLYGGAQLFHADYVQKLGKIAIQTFQQYIPNPTTLAKLLAPEKNVASSEMGSYQYLYNLVTEKLQREPIEDYRIDFEDGYGTHPDNEEDQLAIFTAKELAQAVKAKQVSPCVGIRIKALNTKTCRRAIQTLDLFITTLAGELNHTLPQYFAVTLPKIVEPCEVEALADILDALETQLNLPQKSIAIELMMETPQALFVDGQVVVSQLLDASKGRCVAVHFGPYDYMSSLEIPSSEQTLNNPICLEARHLLKLALAGTHIRLADGPTITLPIAPHRGANLTTQQQEENSQYILSSWKMSYQNIRESLRQGYYQGWDLHPAQLPIRYLTVYEFLRIDLDKAIARVQNFVQQRGMATTIDNILDDAATIRGLAFWILQAVDCGALKIENNLAISRSQLEELTLLKD